MYESTGGPHERSAQNTRGVSIHCLGTLHRRKTMEHRRLINEASNYNSNLRAEDCSRMQDRQSAFREFILVPLRFLCALLLVILLMSHSALAQARGGTP